MADFIDSEAESDVSSKKTSGFLEINGQRRAFSIYLVNYPILFPFIYRDGNMSKVKIYALMVHGQLILNADVRVYDGVLISRVIFYSID